MDSVGSFECFNNKKKDDEITLKFLQHGPVGDDFESAAISSTSLNSVIYRGSICLCAKYYIYLFV